MDIEVSKGKIQSIISNTQFFIIPNLNIRIGMWIGIGEEAQQIIDFNQETGKVKVGSSFTTVQIDVGTDYAIVSDFIDQFPSESLYVRNTPQVYITNVKTVTTKSYTFYGAYIQQQNVPIVYYQFNIYQVGKNDNILLMSFKEDNARIECFYDGFLNGQDYLVELIVLNEFNIKVSTEQMHFTAVYDTPAYLNKPQITYINDRNAFQVQFQADIKIPPTTQQLGVLQERILEVLSDTSFKVLKGLNIHPNDEITIGFWNTATVLNYDINTGILITTKFKSNPNYDDLFFTSRPPELGLQGLNLLFNHPYRRVNSMQLNHSLIYDGNTIPQGLVNDFPDNWQLTTQLLFNEDFAEQIHNNKYVYTNVYDINCDDYNCIGLKIGVRRLDLITLMPNSMEYNTLTSDYQTQDTVYLTNGIDIDTQKFIIFRDYNSYVAEIASYDDSTQAVTLTKPLPFIPQSGDYVYNPISMITPFLGTENIVDEFVLREVRNEQEYTKWVDKNNKWDDMLWWTETGGFRNLVANKWWKIVIDNMDGGNVTIQEGGV